MKKLFCFILLPLILAACARQDQNNSLDHYRSHADNLIKKIEDRPFDSIEAQAKVLVTKGQDILKELSTRWPMCQRYFSKVVSEAKNMSRLKLNEIEKKFHEGESLLTADDQCVNAKELVVHPATVLVLINKKDTKKVRNHMKDEIEEVLSHLDILL